MLWLTVYYANPIIYLSIKKETKNLGSLKYRVFTSLRNQETVKFPKYILMENSNGFQIAFLRLAF